MTQTTLRSEVTGTVRRIVAEPGATLAEDDTIIFLESMKMEIPLVASAACRPTLKPTVKAKLKKLLTSF